MSNSNSFLGRRGFLTGVFGGTCAGVAGTYTSWQYAPEKWYSNSLPDGSKLSYAQNGEDLVIASLFAIMNVTRPSYLDIGAFHPIICSNTYHMYRSGGRGVLVEPNPDLTKLLSNERPGDIVLTAGIGVDATKAADYYLMTKPQNNTFDKETAERLHNAPNSQCKILDVIKMPLLPINEVIAEHFGQQAPDLLSIDVEGLDEAILRTLDFQRYRPRIICSEHSQSSKTRNEFVNFVVSQGYVVRGLTFPNTIFVDERRFQIG